ncbi:MAG TPA: hypothetical protein VGD75_03880, partial [Bradyrhizobium sp.]
MRPRRSSTFGTYLKQLFSLPPSCWAIAGTGVAKPAARYVCQNCGAAYPKWVGRCEACGEWNTLVEETAEARPGASRSAGKRVAFVGLQGAAEPPPR